MSSSFRFPSLLTSPSPYLLPQSSWKPPSTLESTHTLNPSSLLTSLYADPIHPPQQVQLPPSSQLSQLLLLLTLTEQPLPPRRPSSLLPHQLSFTPQLPPLLNLSHPSFPPPRSDRTQPPPISLPNPTSPPRPLVLLAPAQPLPPEQPLLIRPPPQHRKLSSRRSSCRPPRRPRCRSS